jgi:hypothetical protein
MADRRFGPSQGAGIVVLERDPGQPIEDAPTGVVAFLGRPERSAKDIEDCSNRKSYVRLCGSYTDDDELAHAAFDFYRHSEGAGRVYVVPVLAGDEIAAKDVAFSRRTHKGEYKNRSTQSTAKNALLSIVARAGHAAGGRERVRTGTVSIPGDVTETTLDTGAALVADEFVGAILESVAVTSRTYKVISNDAAGVLTLEADSTLASDIAASASPSEGGYRLYLDNKVRTFDGPGSVAGTRAAFSLNWLDAEDNEDSSLFGLEVLIDGDVVSRYPNLSLDPANKYSIANVIGKDPDRFIDVTVNYVGAYDAARRPASWYGEYVGYSAGTTSIRAAWLAGVSLQAPTSRDVGFVNAFTVPARAVRQRILLTFTGPTTFNVSTTASQGAEHLNLAAGTVGTPYAPGNLYMPGFTVQAGVDAFVSGDVLTIEVDPLPVDLADGSGLLAGLVYVDAGAGDLTRLRIGDNTPSSFDFGVAPATPPTAAKAIGEASGVVSISTGALTFALLVEGTYSIVTDKDGLVSLTTAAQPYAAIGDLITELNTQAVAAGIDPFFADDGSGGVGIDPALYTGTEVGQDSFIRVVAAVANHNIAAEQWIVGTDGDEYRIQAPRTLRDGFDGASPSDSDYIDLLDPVASPLNKLLPTAGQNLGLIKIAIPGVTSTAVQKALASYAEAKNLGFRYEIPEGTVTEASAIAYINNTLGRSNYGTVSFPSYADVVNPIGSGTVRRSLTGALLGREARVARVYGGYHKPAAGIDVDLPTVVDLPTGDAVLDEELLNPQGLQVIKKMRGRYVMWGARTIGSPGWKWANQRQQISHYEQVLAANFDWVIFQLNDRKLWGRLRASFLEFGRAEFAKGALRGDKLADGWQIKIDNENNPAASIEAGDVSLSLSIWPAQAVERLNLIVNKAGVFEIAS